MKAKAEMNNGGECDLLKYLSEEKEFGLTKEEMEALLEPARYIGRCPEQVENFLSAVKPVIADVERTSAQILL